MRHNLCNVLCITQSYNCNNIIVRRNLGYVLCIKQSFNCNKITIRHNLGNVLCLNYHVIIIKLIKANVFSIAISRL